MLAGGVFGVAIGLLAGFFGGLLDQVLMRLTDMQFALPMMPLALLTISVFGASLETLIVVLALASWVRYARVVRGQVLSVRSREFVLAARAIDASTLRILWRHILPNVLSSILVIATLELARAIILESGLSYLGLGVQPPSASWGRMLAEGRTYVSTHWWLSAFPGLAIVMTVLAINLLGDWLRDYADPKLR